MADKDEEGTAGEPTSDDQSTPSASSSGSHAMRADDTAASADREVEEGREPTGDELAASGYDTAGRSDVADLDHVGTGSVHDEKTDDDRVDADVDALEPVAAGAVGRGRDHPRGSGRPRRRRRRPRPGADRVRTAARLDVGPGDG